MLLHEVLSNDQTLRGRSLLITMRQAGKRVARPPSIALCRFWPTAASSSRSSLATNWLTTSTPSARLLTTTWSAGRAAGSSSSTAPRSSTCVRPSPSARGFRPQVIASRSPACVRPAPKAAQPRPSPTPAPRPRRQPRMILVQAGGISGPGVSCRRGLRPEPVSIGRGLRPRIPRRKESERAAAFARGVHQTPGRCYPLVFRPPSRLSGSIFLLALLSPPRALQSPPPSAGAASGTLRRFQAGSQARHGRPCNGSSPNVGRSAECGSPPGHLPARRPVAP